MAKPLPDVQASSDGRGLPIDEAGVSGLRCAIAVADPDTGKQNTVAKFAASVRVPSEAKGAHLSRLVESLSAELDELSLSTVGPALRDLALQMQADEARLQVEFPYFVARSAPVTGRTALLDVECRLVAHLRRGDVSVELSATTPITTLCPCSKAVSDYGAHNQRTYVTVAVRPIWNTKLERFEGPWFDELIQIAEACGSSPIYPVLKRPDERFVTMHAYDHPAFVEDVVREVALHMLDESRISAFKIEARSVESIHNHDAFACIRHQWESAI